MKPVRIAVVGAGLIGKQHLRVLRESSACEVAAIADPSPAAASLAKEADVPHYADYRQMLERAKPDGAVVATPNQQHVVVGLACIERGVPILVEKPIADSVAEALTLVSAGEKARVPILTGHHRRHSPIMKRAAEAIGGGAVGRVTAVAGLWLSRKPDNYFNLTWRKEPGGGPILINGIHEIDCLRMLCGDIDTVQAQTANGVRNFPVEDTAAAVLRFKNGALGTLILSDTVSSPWTWERGSYENPIWPHESQNCYFVTGTRGALTVPSLELWSQEASQGWADPLTRQRYHYVPADSYVEQMRNFADVIRGQADPVISGREGMVTLAATLAIAQSARTGSPVRVDDMLASL